MGVQDLWSIVEPVRESVPLYSLSGKTLAVDLSLWVCEAQHVQAMMGRVNKPHLRNLFFRVSSLTLMGIKLVFVMEGEAPKLKAETMNKRQQARYGKFKKASATKASTNTSRGRFNAVLRECAEMLDYLGVPWVTAAGEAEAMCAYLDSQGLVDGCITNDGDAFLYGARTVYRNFNMNSKDPQVDCYRTSRVQTELHLSRENLVGLAIFLGCDYIPKGIPGVGKEQALKLIQTLKGQTLLHRFNQWKEDNTSVSEGVVKKVPHCQVCRHPGSAKAHERGGCVLCDSKHFCQPQDFDYQCQCDWHRYERTRQALSFEANIKKKTLASQQFPFTEIIHEFLISKDKPVSHFKRRQPNMLLMQKFANDKMEWPKHYTSEKVLVLMTYTELMNKKYGRETSSQIKPLRILKPRVRNAVACFEVIWSTPEHYVFPEDQPEGQHEVRTVEEESLFRVAFPEVVERYLRDKALAEENKNQKKKSRKKKEKPSDLSDGISDLLAQMSLQGSSSSNPTTQPQTLPPTISTTEKTEVIVVDTPVIHKQRSNSKDDHINVGDCPNTPLSYVESQAATSLSVSVVIDALHLSDIDWDALSFTSSPTPQATTSHTTELKTNEAADGDVKEMENTKQKTSNDDKEADSRSAPEMCYTECPLRERVLMRNTVTNQREAINDVVSKQLNYESASVEHISPPSSDSKPDGQFSRKGGSDSCLSGTKSGVNTKEACTDKVQCGKNKAETETHSSKKALLPTVQDKAKDKCSVSQKPPQKYKFVKTANISSAVQAQVLQSEPSQSDKCRNVSQTRSVCLNVCSSSEDSDAENQQYGFQRKNKIKSVNKVRGGSITDFPLKPVFGPKTTKEIKPTYRLKPTGQRSRRESPDAVTNETAVSTTSKCQDAPPAIVGSDTLCQTPSSPVIMLDSDDSVICSDSPLPLAERLRLKFLK